MDSDFTSWPLHTQEEVDAVQAVLLLNKTKYWTGEECKKFERIY